MNANLNSDTPYMTCHKDGHDVQRRFHVEGGKQIPELQAGEQVFYSVGSNVPEIVQGQLPYAGVEASLQHNSERMDPGMFGGW